MPLFASLRFKGGGALSVDLVLSAEKNSISGGLVGLGLCLVGLCLYQIGLYDLPRDGGYVTSVPISTLPRIEPILLHGGGSLSADHALGVGENGVVTLLGHLK